MESAFGDAAYWIALIIPSDELHQKARLVTRQLEPLHIVTSEMVLVEFLNHVSRLGQHNRLRATDTVIRLYNDPEVEVVPQTSERFWAAVERYAARLDQRWSLTDCSSFLIMEERRISRALTYDRDFVQAGFRALLREGN